MKRAARLASALVAALSVCFLTACDHRAQSAHKLTALTIRVQATSGSRTFELRCDPPGGTAPYPGRLCASLAAQTQDIPLRTIPPNFGPRHIRVSGVFEGRRVSDGEYVIPRNWFVILIPAASA